jgi:hypothetical protein
MIPLPMLPLPALSLPTIPLPTLIFAGMVIAGVYPDPFLAENGGEAVALINPGTTPVSTEGLAIATKTSVHNLPTATVLPGTGYLITDINWSSLRDNATWPDADFETALTLANADGFVELRELQENGSYTILDRLAWNATVGRPREGMLWTRTGETFPSFLNTSMQQTVFFVTTEVAPERPTLSILFFTDDTPLPGTQLFAYERTVTIRVAATNGSVVTARLAGRETELEETTTFSLTSPNHMKSYQGAIKLPALAPGRYTLSVSATTDASETTTTADVTVLATSTITATPLVLRGENRTGTLTVTNKGNTRRTVSLSLPPGVMCLPERVTLAGEGSQTFTCAARNPVNATALAVAAPENP